MNYFIEFDLLYFQTPTRALPLVRVSKCHRAHIEQINGKVLVNITKSKKECDGIGFHQFLQVTYHKN